MEKEKSPPALKIEKPVLDLHDHQRHKHLPKAIPDHMLDDVKVIDKSDEDVEVGLNPLINDTKVFLDIKDVESAKKTYRELMSLYNKLSKEEKKQYYNSVHKLYDDIQQQGSFLHRLFKR